MMYRLLSKLFRVTDLWQFPRHLLGNPAECQYCLLLYLGCTLSLSYFCLFVCFFRFSVHLVFFKRDAMVFRKLGEGYSYYFNLSLQRFISKFCGPLFLSGRTPVNNKMLHDQIESLTLKEMFTILFKCIAVVVATDSRQLNFK